MLAIVAGVIGLVLPKIGNQNNQMKAAVRRFSVLTRQVRANARLYGASYRIAFDLGQRLDDQQMYWVEKADKGVLIPSDKKEYLESKNTAAKVQKDRKGKEDKKLMADDGFSPDPKTFRKKQSLPGGLRFREIELVGLEQPVSTGLVYIHFHPQGLVEEAAIHFRYGRESEEGLEWTIAIHPLTGQADIITENVSLEEIREQ